MVHRLSAVSGSVGIALLGLVLALSSCRHSTPAPAEPLPSQGGSASSDAPARPQHEDQGPDPAPETAEPPLAVVPVAPTRAVPSALVGYWALHLDGNRLRYPSWTAELRADGSSVEGTLSQGAYVPQVCWGELRQGAGGLELECEEMGFSLAVALAPGGDRLTVACRERAEPCTTSFSSAPIELERVDALHRMMWTGDFVDMGEEADGQGYNERDYAFVLGVYDAARRGLAAGGVDQSALTWPALRDVIDQALRAAGVDTGLYAPCVSSREGCDAAFASAERAVEAFATRLPVGRGAQGSSAGPPPRR